MPSIAYYMARRGRCTNLDKLDKLDKVDKHTARNLPSQLDTGRPSGYPKPTVVAQKYAEKSAPRPPDGEKAPPLDLLVV